MRSSILLIVAILAVACHGQDYPENPGNCNENTCEGCVPFMPKAGKADDMRCGINDVYFAVPVSIIRNDTSANQELTPQKWLCVPCCIAGCGFSDPGSQCNVDVYTYPKDGKTDYGCTKCGGGTSKNPGGGSVKTYFEDASTSSVYSVANMPWGTCVDGPVPSPPAPVPSPSLSPTPIPVPSPPSNAPSLAPSPVPVPVPSPAVIPSPVPAPVPAPAPAPAPVEPTAPPPQIIITSAPPPPSAASRTFATTTTLLAVVAMAVTFA